MEAAVGDHFIDISRKRRVLVEQDYVGGDIVILIVVGGVV